MPLFVRGGAGTTAWEGARIKEWRPHWSILHKSHAEDAALYGSEAEKWKQNPILHPIRYLRDPYYLEERHYQDRPYPVSSPAFTNVPLIGPILAATIGRLVKPPIRTHEAEWDGTKYTLYSPRLEPRGPDALPPPLPKDEYSLGNVFSKEANIFAEYILADVAPYSREYNQVKTSFSSFCHLRKLSPPGGIFFAMSMYASYLHAAGAGDSRFMPGAGNFSDSETAPPGKDHSETAPNEPGWF